MEKKLRIGIIKETKSPPDRRVALPPVACLELLHKYAGIEIFVEASDFRCFTDEEYRQAGIPVTNDLSNCDVLLGIKEVKIHALLPGKKYFFFAHVIKKQPYNRHLLQDVLKKNIQLLDYEILTRKDGSRVAAFGHWAGVVGAYNGIRAIGFRTGKFNLKPAHEYHDLKELYEDLEKLKIDPLKILISGSGRVAHGALQTLNVLNIKRVTPNEFLNQSFNEPVVCLIDPEHYTRHKDGKPFNLNHFFSLPAEYLSAFQPFTKVTDVYFPCHFWHPQSPVFFTLEDIKIPDFKISIISDISCDIDGPIPTTIRPSTNESPFYDVNPLTGMEEPAFSNPKNINVSAVDNLPTELPRDASMDFSGALIQNVFPYLIDEDIDGVLERALITKDRKLTDRYSYLQRYVDGKE
jgi:alanine dehydrogenase